MVPTGWADVRYWAERSPVVFRGHITRIEDDKQPTGPYVHEGVATIHVDRIYKGEVPAELAFAFAYPGVEFGHDCMDFELNTHWLVFVRQSGSLLELADDCEGALPISPLMGQKLRNVDWRAQMETDFLAGLSDRDPTGRLYSIQRLGGLKSPSSRPALHQVIEKGSHEESVWAVYAALRTDDASVLPTVQRLLASGDPVTGKTGIAFELQHVSDLKALPGLIAILESSHDELATSRVLIALGQNLKDPRSLPVIAEHLSDPLGNNSSIALEGMGNITGSPACIPTSEHDYPSRLEKCKAWWNNIGKFKSWPRPNLQ